MLRPVGISGTPADTQSRTVHRESQMARARPRRSPIGFQPGAAAPAEPTLFPASVAGEQYARYAKSVWAQAHRWLELHWVRAAHGAGTMLDVRQKLRSIAATDIKRHLYAHEEQLLSDIVQATWDAN